MRSLQVRVTALAAGAALLCASADSPFPRATAQERVQEPYSAAATAVVVDVVVRDRRGQPITDLTAEDFEIYEDGVKQTLGAFTGAGTHVSGTVGGSGSTPPTPFGAVRAPTALPPVPAAPPVVALVFDRLSPEARSLATKAALSYLADDRRVEGERVGVFSIDLSLRPLQNYTANLALVRRAVEQFAKRSTGQFGANAEQMDAAAARQAAAEGQAAAGAATIAAGGAGAAAGGQQAGAAMADQQMAAMQERMLQAVETLERDQQGYATTNGLLAVISALRVLPGRKTVVFFSEGVALPPAVIHHFNSVIDTANSSNVAVYTMDASGLRIHSGTAGSQQQIAAQGRRRVEGFGREVMGSMMQAMERNEDALKGDPQSGLQQLAEETGGFAIRDTNNLSSAFQRIETDIRSHYLLTYAPTNDNFDGRFRAIQVRVRRPNVEVRARRGYLAVRDSSGVPLLSYEAPAVAMLQLNPKPNEFTIHSRAFSFPESKRPGLAPVLVELRQGVLEHEQRQDGTFRAEAAVVVQFRDELGQVARKLSQNYDLTGPVALLETAKQGQLLFYRDPELPPGTYSIETVVYDAVGQKASVRTGSLEVPQASPDALRLSSIVLVKRSERLPPEDQAADNPLFAQGMVFYPNLGEPLRKSLTPELTFYFTMYPGRARNVTAQLELLRGGQAVAAAPLEAAAPDARGRIQQSGRLPIQELAPGGYEIRVTATDGTHTASRSSLFTVLP